MTLTATCPHCERDGIRVNGDGSLRRHYVGARSRNPHISKSPADLWDNESAPAGAGNTTRGLTHSSGLGREGLAMQPTHTLPANAAERILAKRSITESGCWEWQSSHIGIGYGYISLGGHRYLVHRVSAALWLGLDLADRSTFACHRCDNPRCFNPEHLFLGSHRDNMRDAARKGRMRQPTIYPRVRACDFCGQAYEPHPDRRSRSRVCSQECASGLRGQQRRGKGYRVTPGMVEGIRELIAQGWTGADVARHYGVSRATVSVIKNGKRVITR